MYEIAEKEAEIAEIQNLLELPETSADYEKLLELTEKFDLFKNKIRDFEYKNKRLEFRVSQRQYDKFMALDGKSK